MYPLVCVCVFGVAEGITSMCWKPTQTWGWHASTTHTGLGVGIKSGIVLLWSNRANRRAAQRKRDNASSIVKLSRKSPSPRGVSSLSVSEFISCLSGHSATTLSSANVFVSILLPVIYFSPLLTLFPWLPPSIFLPHLSIPFFPPLYLSPSAPCSL